ncbi:MAG: BatD family protein [Gammaproteobacteria bacterium]|nr:BatD family protein [Gammaproteobacteria bacterium]
MVIGELFQQSAKICRSALLLISALALATVAAQELSLRASVDRPIVEENESFTYVLRAEGPVRGEPDFSLMAAQFDILQRSRNTTIQMAGGRTTQITEWQVQLMPRQTGSYTLPPVVLSGSLSNPVDVEVLSTPTTSAAGDIFIEVHATPDDPYVQSQVVYTMTLFRGIRTGRSSLTLPEVSGGEAIIEKLGQDREFQTVLDGRNFIALERRYAIFPQVSGPLTIDPVTFEAVVISPSGFSNVQRYHSEPLPLRVRSAVPPPAAYADAVWLPAQALSLDENWSAGDGELTVGIPQTRTLIINADGVLETQLPELEFPQSASIRQYSDQPELGREAEQDGIRARRTERFAVLAQSSGVHVLPEIALPWFNVPAERWDIARIPARSLDVLAGFVPIAQDTVSQASDDSTISVLQTNDRIWRGISAALLGAWLITLGLWWRSQRPVSASAGSEQEATPSRMANRRLLRQLRGACDENDSRQARQLLLAWGELRFPDSSPRSLGALAALLPQDYARAVQELERDLYGPETGRWSGESLRAALANMNSVSRSFDITSSEDLLPLYR